MHCIFDNIYWEGILMKLNEAKTLISRMSRKISDLNHQRTVNSLVEIAPGENPLEYISEQPDEITRKLLFIYDERRKLKDAFRLANNRKFPISINGEEKETSISELIDLVKDIRMEAYYFNSYSKKLPKTRLSQAKQETIQVITFDRNEYNQKAEQLEGFAENISNLIDHYDSIIDVDYTIPDNLF